MSQTELPQELVTADDARVRTSVFRQFFRDSAVYGATSVLSRGVPILLLPFYTRVFSASDYGIVELLTILITLVNLSVALEISQGVGRYFAEARQDERAVYASTALWFTAAAFSAFVALAYVLSGPLAAWLLEPEAGRSVMRAALLASWAYGLFYVTQHQLRWELQPTRYALATLAFTVVTIGTTVLLVSGADLGVRGVFFGQLAGSAVGAALAVFFARASYRPIFDAAKWREMLAYSLPLVPSSMAVFVAFYVDRFAIRELRTLHDVGIYSAGYRVASMIGLVMVAAQAALTPLVFAHYRRPDTPAQLARIFRYFLVLAFAAFLVLSAFSRDLLALLATGSYASAAVLVPLLVPSILLWNMNIFAPGLFIAKRTRFVALVNGAAALANVVLCFALVPPLGIRGAALATLATSVGAFGVFMRQSQRLYPAPHEWARIALALATVATVASVLEALAENGYLAASTGSAILVKAAIVAAATSMAALALIGPREAAQLARRARPA